MKVGISHLILGGKPLADFFKESAEAGYEVVELCIKREGELTTETSTADLKRIREQAKNHGLSIDSVTHSHCTGNLLASGEVQQRSIDETKAGLRVASELGAYCTLHTLGRLSPDLPYDEAYMNGVKSLEALAPVAEELNVAIAAEFVWNGFLFSPLEMRRFLEEVGSDQVGFYFDPGNMAVFQYPQHWVHVLGKHIKMAHMKDWQGRALNGGWTPLLEGEVDFPAVMKELVAAGYDGPLISEVSPGMASIKDTADAIRKIIQMTD
jgi:hexulose-6-phosphate isomerase